MKPANFTLSVHVDERMDSHKQYSTLVRHVHIKVTDIDLASKDHTLGYALRFAQRIARMFQDMPTPCEIEIDGKVGA